MKCACVRCGDAFEAVPVGGHRIACADATDPADVARALGGRKPHLMVTDPPYGVSYDANWRNDALQAGNSVRGAPGGRAVGKVNNDDRADWRAAWVLFPGDVAYVWHAGIMSDVSADSLKSSGFEIRAQIVWAKHQMVIGRGHYHGQHEPCWYAVRKGGTGHWQGARDQTTLWQINKPQKSETGHSAQKPVECMRRPIENNAEPGDGVYDPFIGSGTTAIACEMTSRLCVGIEVHPPYADVVVVRWQNYTGERAILESTGQDYGETKRLRAGTETVTDAAAD